MFRDGAYDDAEALSSDGLLFGPTTSAFDTVPASIAKAKGRTAIKAWVKRWLLGASRAKDAHMHFRMLEA